MSHQPVRVAVIGCGMISDIYLENLAKWPILDVRAVADLDPARSAAKAAKYSIARALSPDEALADSSIEAILNLTIPAAHASVALSAVRAGKSVYNEKPLAIAREDARRLLDEAASRGLRVGGAPDTFLGAGLQTCRHLIDEGSLGSPVAATAAFLTAGPDAWHPDPAFLFAKGAGPLFDMGPYYITALVSLYGPIGRVTGVGHVARPQRTVGSGPKAGQVFPVETPSHVAALLEFRSGAIATLVTSFDVWDPRYTTTLGLNLTAGAVEAPDPNDFGGPVRVRSATTPDAADVPLLFGHDTNSRGIGFADMAYAIRTGRAHRASGELAYHVLDVMHSILEASESGRHVDVASTCERPAPMPLGLADDTLDD